MKIRHQLSRRGLSTSKVLLLILCSATSGSAAFISYEWSYRAPGGAHVIGNLSASGTGADGFLDLVSINGLTFRDIDAGSWSPWLFATGTANISADGSTRGLSMNLEMDYLGNPTWLIISQILPSAPFENELGYTGIGGNLHTMEYVGNECLWTLSPSAIRVPDGGGTLTIYLLVAGSLSISNLMVRSRID